MKEACGPFYSKLCRIASSLDLWVELTVGKEQYGIGQEIRRELGFLIVHSVNDTVDSFAQVEPLEDTTIEGASLELMKRLGWVRDSEIPA